MRKIAQHLTELVGNTPLLELKNYSEHTGLKARVIAKLEYFNPAGSVKDRVALAITALKKHNPRVQVIAVEPEDSPVLPGGIPGPHKIQGIGAGFIPENYDNTVVDGILQVSADDAIRTSRELARYEGLLVGISSGAAVSAATRLAQLPENEGKVIVVLLPDTGDRYLSTLLYAFEEYPL